VFHQSLENHYRRSPTVPSNALQQTVLGDKGRHTGPAAAYKMLQIQPPTDYDCLTSQAKIARISYKVGDFVLISEEEKILSVVQISNIFVCSYTVVPLKCGSNTKLICMKKWKTGPRPFLGKGSPLCGGRSGTHDVREIRSKKGPSLPQRPVQFEV
jgi:hypothetical protein